MASMEQWRFQIEALKSKYNIVAYDFFGCGNSPRLMDSWESYSTKEHLADLVEIFDRNKTRYNFIVGHSFGTSQTLRLARLRGSELHGCVLVAPALFPDGGHPIFHLPEFILNWIQPSLSQAFFKMGFHPTTREARTDAHRELLKVALARMNSNSMHVAKSFYRQVKFIKKDEVTAIDGRIPMIMICANEDLITPMAMALEMKTWLSLRENFAEPVKIEVVGPASHQLMEEQPEAVNEIMMRFFESCEKRMMTSAASSSL